MDSGININAVDGVSFFTILLPTVFVFFIYYDILTFLQRLQTALHYASFNGHLEVVQFLVEHNIQICLKDSVWFYFKNGDDQ